MSIYSFIFICILRCVCSHAHTYTHTHTHAFMYHCGCVSVCLSWTGENECEVQWYRDPQSPPAPHPSHESCNVGTRGKRV